MNVARQPMPYPHYCRHAIAGLLLFCGAAAAEESPAWTFLDTRLGGVLYIDNSRTVVAEQMATVWMLADIPEPPEDVPFRSAVMKMEVDCQARRARTLAMESYPENLGRGDRIESRVLAEDDVTRRWHQGGPMVEAICGTSAEQK